MSTVANVVIGCVSRGTTNPKDLLITDTRGEKPTVFRLEGDPKDLDWHVGHTIEVWGTFTALPAAGTQQAGTAGVLRVASVNYISPTCAKPKS